METLLQEAVDDGIITCGKCDNRLEPDADRCYCGWKNPLVEFGFI